MAPPVIVYRQIGQPTVLFETMAQINIPHGIGDIPRDLNTFEPFPLVEGISTGQLEQWIEALRVQPISAIEWQWQQHWAVGPRAINDSMWFWIQKGYGHGWTGNRANQFRLGPGDLMLIPQGIEHRITQDEGEAMHLIAVHFHAHVFGGINVLELLGFPPRIPDLPDGFFAGASRRLAREFAVKAPGWTTAMTTEIFNVLVLALRNYGSEFRATAGAISHTELPRLLPALETIDRHIANPQLTVGELAKRVFLSEVQFRKLFKRVTGINPVRFIQRRRVERACVMLRTTTLGIEQIAEACGFSDPPFFFRIFRLWTGTSPNQYRSAERI